MNKLELRQYFADYWRETHCEGDEGSPSERMYAYDAFLLGFELGCKEPSPFEKEFRDFLKRAMG